ncbi:Gfo/Idh/MocA family protein [Polaromonas sp. YR568]|uniref:Gfo/Idh/MocA family protein n=1 Tax=Polaromonas sp. YR568 TaxID=1855301 RepID=UPI00398C21CA
MSESCVIIGLGQIGVGYDLDLPADAAVYTHARAIVAHPAFHLVGGVDVSPEQRARFEQHYAVPAFDSVESALRLLQPDVVVIATSSASHGAILAEVVRTCRPKLIVCEKPLAYQLEEARAMVRICEDAGIGLFVNYIRRTDPGVIEIKRRIESGEISTPVKGNAWYSKGILNNGSHFLNLLEFWLGDITSTTVIDSGRLWDDHDPEPDVEVRFERGAVVFRAAWEEAFSYYGVELLSHSGRLRYERGGELIEWQAVYSDPRFKGYKILGGEREEIANGMAIYQWHVYDQIRDYFAGKATALCTGLQALKTLEAIELIIKQRKS